jgi:hypothetical protein
MSRVVVLVGIVLTALLTVVTPAWVGPGCPDIPGVCPTGDVAW